MYSPKQTLPTLFAFFLKIIFALTLGSCATGGAAQPQEQSETAISNGAVNKSSHLVHHRYQKGEIIDFDFENSENMYRSIRDPQFGIIPQELMGIEELHVRVRITVLDTSGSAPQKQMEIVEATMRSSLGHDFSVSHYNKAEFVPITELIPNFPKHFRYTYTTDSQAVRTELLKGMAPYLKNQVAWTLYYKLLDIHTFQSTIDSIPVTLKPGQVHQGETTHINLAGQIFVNNAPTINYEKRFNNQGTKFAYFKDATMGNSFEAMNGSKFRTNYTHSFSVSLDGHHQGLLEYGELQETVFGELAGETEPYFLQRQLSMKRIIP